jgi:hypothetical protein
LVEKGATNGDIPVHAGLPCSVSEAVEYVQDERATEARIGPILLRVVFILGPGTVISGLKLVSSAPNDHDQDEESSPCALGTHGTAHSLQVKSEAENVCANNLHEIVDYAVEGPSPSVEVSTVNLVKVVGIEPVGCEEHGEQSHDIRIGPENLVETENLRLPGWVFHDNDLGAVVSNYVLGVNQSPGEGGANEGEDQESNIGTVTDDGVASCVDVLAKRNQTTDDCTEVENHPKPRDVAALGGLGGVRHHDCALSAPQKTGAGTEKSTREGNKSKILGVVVAQVGSNIDRVADAAKG